MSSKSENNCGVSCFPLSNSKNNNEKNEKEENISSKVEIGTPTGFQHLSHVGLDKNNGFVSKFNTEKTQENQLEEEQEPELEVKSFTQRKKLLEGKGKMIMLGLGPQKLMDPSQKKIKRKAPVPPLTPNTESNEEKVLETTDVSFDKKQEMNKEEDPPVNSVSIPKMKKPIPTPRTLMNTS